MAIEGKAGHPTRPNYSFPKSSFPTTLIYFEILLKIHTNPGIVMLHPLSV
jgi:hypothetical protein